MPRKARRLVIPLLALAGTLVTGTVGYVVIDGYPPFEAFYMALTTMATVGYGEIIPLSTAGRVFNVFVILFGVTAILVTMGAITQIVIEAEFGDAIGKRRAKRMIENLKDHYIICGYGRVGRGAAAELKRAGVPFVVVDNSQPHVERATADGMLALVADATRDETLRQAGTESARGLVAALPTDAENLFVLLSAKGLNANIFVATRAAEDGAEEKMRRAGADAVIAPYTITGHRLAQTLLRPHVLQFLDFTTKQMDLGVAIEQTPVAEHSEIAGKTIEEMQIRRSTGVIVMAVRKRNGEMLFNPPADTAIQGGDYLIVMGRPENLRALEHLLAGPRAGKR